MLRPASLAQQQQQQHRRHVPVPDPMRRLSTLGTLLDQFIDDVELVDGELMAAEAAEGGGHVGGGGGGGMDGPAGTWPPAPAAEPAPAATEEAQAADWVTGLVIDGGDGTGAAAGPPIPLLHDCWRQYDTLEVCHAATLLGEEALQHLVASRAAAASAAAVPAAAVPAATAAAAAAASVAAAHHREQLQLLNHMVWLGVAAGVSAAARCSSSALHACPGEATTAVATTNTNTNTSFFRMTSSGDGDDGSNSGTCKAHPKTQDGASGVGVGAVAVGDLTDMTGCGPGGGLLQLSPVFAGSSGSSSSSSSGGMPIAFLTMHSEQ